MYFRILALTCLVAASLTSRTYAEEHSLALEPLIEEALAQNPSLHALEDRVDAFEARIPRAGALADPTFRIEASNLPITRFDYDSTPMSGNQLVVSQVLPFPGTRSAKERAARAAADGVRSDLEDHRAVVVKMVKQAYYDLAFVDRAIAVTREHEALLRDLVRIAQTKYAVGRGLQQDVLKAQVALSSLQERLIGLETRRDVTEARLNLVLNRDVDASLGRPTLRSMTVLSLAISDLRAEALAERPMLKGVQASVEAWRAREEAASRQMWPNLSFSLGYRQRAVVPGDPVAGEDFVSFGAGLNIPLYRGRKQKQQVLEARAEMRAAQSRLEAARQQVVFNIRRLWLVEQQHRREAELFQSTIIPQAELSLASARAGYGADKVDFLALLDSQASLLSFRIRTSYHVAEHEKTLAELEAVVGRRFLLSGSTD